VLSPEAGASLADGVEHSLHPAWIDLQRLVGWIVWIIFVPLLLLALLTAVFGTTLPVWFKAMLFAGWLALAILLGWLWQKWPEVEYRHFGYRVDADGIQIKRGVIWRSLVSVPRSRVQHIDVSQGPLERRYELASLSIYTAGTDFAKVDLPGLSYPRAVRLRDHLLPGREHAADDGT
jgi:membrane protein YdbS with pleckstrin-like domain